jgi:hypothetical protein
MPVHKSRLGDACAPDRDDESRLALGWAANERRDGGYWGVVDSVIRVLQAESLEEGLRAVRMLRTALLEWLLSDAENAAFDDDVEDDAADLEADAFGSDDEFQFSDSTFDPLLGPDDAEPDGLEPSDEDDGVGTQFSAYLARGLLGTDRTSLAHAQPRSNNAN